MELKEENDLVWSGFIVDWDWKFKFGSGVISAIRLEEIV